MHRASTKATQNWGPYLAALVKVGAITAAFAGKAGRAGLVIGVADLTVKGINRRGPTARSRMRRPPSAAVLARGDAMLAEQRNQINTGAAALQPKLGSSSNS